MWRLLSAMNPFVSMLTVVLACLSIVVADPASLVLLVGSWLLLAGNIVYGVRRARTGA